MSSPSAFPAAPQVSAVRCAVVGLAGSGLLLAGAAWCAASAVPLLALLLTGAPSPDPSAPVLVLAGAAGSLACLRLAGVVAVTCWRAGRGATVSADGWARRATLAACGTAISLAALVPAHAADLSDLDGLPYPDRPTSASVVEPATPPPVRTTTAVPQPSDEPGSTATRQPSRGATKASQAPATRSPSTTTRSPSTSRPTPSHKATARAPSPAAHRPVASTSGVATARASTSRHVVVPGDTLWALASTHLASGPDATTVDDAAIARATHALHAANRTVIGADPDLLLPGQELSLPTAAPQEDR